LGKQIFKNDIGKYIQNNCEKNVEDFECQDILRNTWTPDSNYDFPMKLFGKRRRKCNLSWLQQWNWLVYSDLDKGVFYKYCVLFCKRVGAGKGMHSPSGGFKGSNEVGKSKRGTS
jgi:hypothetical protein